ncbi:MAG: hypothetical protein U9Q33_11060 [Campylobacterota bacterium]|nr:hypothetical protein [Campylobacterota bacterium]
MKKYIYIIISVLLIGTIGNSIYKQMNKKSAKAARILCHKNSTVFEKLLKPNLLTKLQADIKNGNIIVTVEEEKAKYMKSRLFDFVNKNEIKDKFEKLLNIKDTVSSKDITSVNILIYENDKEDPGKKTKKSKLYAGYLVFSFKVDKTMVYKLQIDFMDHEGKDIPKILECALKSINTLKTKDNKNGK